MGSVPPVLEQVTEHGVDVAGNSGLDMTDSNAQTGSVDPLTSLVTGTGNAVILSGSNAAGTRFMDPGPSPTAGPTLGRYHDYAASCSQQRVINRLGTRRRA